MILQCPECHARFSVPDTLIPAAGRVVKCGRCAHNWHVDGSDAAAPNEAIAQAAIAAATFSQVVEATAAELEAIAQHVDAAPEAAPETHAKKQAKKPTPRSWPIHKPPLMMAAPALALLWLTLAVMAHYTSWMGKPVVGSMYSTLGIQSTDGLVFDEVHMQKAEKDGKSLYILSGSIANQSAEDRIVPSVRVLLNNAKGEKLWEHEYVVKEPLKAGEVYPFRITNVETSFGDSVAAIVVDLGHSLQLMMR